MPSSFLSDEQAAAYGRFTGPPSRTELERYFFLDDTDKELVGRRRGDHNRLGFALQVVTVRLVGTFLADPVEVPVEVVDYLAEQLGIADASCVKQYAQREPTQREHTGGSAGVRLHRLPPGRGRADNVDRCACLEHRG